MVQSARHAVAIDESKADFKPTLWENLEELNGNRGKDPKAEDAPYQQKWFPGVHGGVGGGGPRRGLSDQALEWIWDGAGNAGLVLDSSKGSPIYSLSPSHLEYLENSEEEEGFSIIGTLMKFMPKSERQPGPQGLHEVSVSAQRRWHEKGDNLPEKSPYRPKPLQQVQPQLEALDSVSLGMGEDGIELAPDKFTAHIVERGDTLSKLAKHYLGDAQRWPEIAAANRYKITNPDLIYVGQSLRIPVAGND
jgi:nucleoid-associated protein YgaU